MPEDIEKIINEGFAKLEKRQDDAIQAGIEKHVNGHLRDIKAIQQAQGEAIYSIGIDFRDHKRKQDDDMKELKELMLYYSGTKKAVSTTRKFFIWLRKAIIWLSAPIVATGGMWLALKGFIHK